MCGKRYDKGVERDIKLKKKQEAESISDEIERAGESVNLALS